MPKQDAVHEIRCEMHSDDHRAECKGNGINWIRRLKDDQLEGLLTEGGGCGYFSDNAMYSLRWAGKLRKYMSFVTEYGIPDVGYSVQFDSNDLARYTKRHRPKVWKLMGKEIEGWIKKPITEGR